MGRVFTTRHAKMVTKRVTSIKCLGCLTRRILGCKQHEVGMGLDDLLQLRDKQLTIVVQQPAGITGIMFDETDQV